MWHPSALAIAFPTGWRYYLPTMTTTVVKHRQPQIQPPSFCSDEEERAFWESHKPGDYLPTTRPAKVQVSRRIRERVRGRARKLALRMESSRVREIKAVAE